MDSSYLDKITAELLNPAQSSSVLSAPQQHESGTEYENVASSSSSAPEFNSEDLIASSNDAARALSSLISGISHHHQGIKLESSIEGGTSDGCHRQSSIDSETPNPGSQSPPIADSSNNIAIASSSDHHPIITLSSSKSEDNDSGDELPEEAPSDAPIHEIRCGQLSARLHMQRFTCPGIHRKCVEFEGKLISPRQFTIKAEKDKQKDWKGSIRLGKHNLRTLMEMKTIDFYEHTTNCSLKCQSRNYIKNRKAEGSASGGDTGGMAFVEGAEDAKATGSFDLCESNEVHSTTSSASTRKSSAVLEDYVSQTIPTVNGPFVPLNLGTFCLNGDEQQQLRSDLFAANGRKTPLQQQSQHQPLVNTSSTGSSHPNTPISTTSSTASCGGGQHNNGNGTPTAGGTFTPTNVNMLQQQSPFKQLFYSPQQQQNQLAPFSTPTNLFPSIGVQQTAIKTTGPRSGALQLQHSTGMSEVQNSKQQENNTLAMLLQSLQTSILMEQQQHKKASLNGGMAIINANNNNNFASLLNGIPSLANGLPTSGNTNQTSSLLNGIEAVLGQQQQRNGSAGIANQQQQQMNSIERLLSAAALFPPQLQSQQQKSAIPLVKPELMTGGNSGGGNVRRIMEENASLFWSQMRSMGLLEDLLNTLSGTLERLKHIYLTGGNVVSEEFAARRLSGVALALDLCTLFSDKIHNRCIQATLETNLITKELLELQRKQEEQKRKLESAKRKSQVFELLKGSPASTGNSANRGGTSDGQPEMKKIHLNI